MFQQIIETQVEFRKAGDDDDEIQQTFQMLLEAEADEIELGGEVCILCSDLLE